MRQLENLCHWLTVMAPAQVVEPKDLPPELLGARRCCRRRRRPLPRSPRSRSQRTRLRRRRRTAAPAPTPTWLADLEREARRRLEAGEPEVWDTLTRLFEGGLIHTALDLTRGRRIEAAQRLGIGRNTITRKIQELGLDD